MAVGLVLAVVAAAGCDDAKSNTQLDPEGPPRVRQVFVTETVLVGGSVRIRDGLAFGEHEDIIGCDGCDDDGVVTTAVATGNQQIRIVLDELVRGNDLEEVACADGSWSRIPRGTTPDDIADCSPPELQRCTAVCIGAGGAVGILDEDEDGAADDFRMIEYATDELGVTLVCGGVNIPLDRELSFYNPSGNQQIPAGPIGKDGLGPAIIIVPSGGMRTASACTINFNMAIQDKDGNQICAPPNGERLGDCTPGNTEEISFSTEALVLEGSNPADAATGVTLTTGALPDKNLLFQFNAGIAMATVGAFALTAGGSPVTATATVSVDDPSLVTVVVAGGLAGDTDYVITLATTLTDSFGGPLPAEVTVSFSTAGVAIPPDADTTDAGAPDA